MDNSIPAGLDRLNALMSWWGVASGDGKNAFPPLTAASDLVAKLQQAYFDAIARNMETVFATNDEVSRAALSLLHAKDAGDLAQIQQALVQALAQATSAQSKSWSEFHQLLLAFAGAAAPQQAPIVETAETSMVTAAVEAVKPQTKGRAATKAPASSVERPLVTAS